MTHRLQQSYLGLLLIFIILQLAGQTSAGLSGKTAGLLNIFTLISYCCLILRAFVWLLILKKLPLTSAYPVTASIYILILPLSMIVFGESPGWSRFAGAALITSGIILTSVGAARNA